MALGQQIDIRDPLPLRTISAFYGGYTPMEHHEGSRVRVRIYRMLKECTPATADPE